MSPHLMARWWLRIAGGAAVFVGLQVLLTVIEADPEPLRLALLVATCTALLGLVRDALDGGEPSWRVDVERPSVRTSGDPRLVHNVGLIEAHLSSRSPDHALRDRLGVLTDQVLRQQHGLRTDAATAAGLLHPDLLAVLEGPPRRLSHAEIDHCLTLIEEL